MKSIIWEIDFQSFDTLRYNSKHDDNLWIFWKMMMLCDKFDVFLFDVQELIDRCQRH
jgi:hypothetical protein